ncbi:MAG: hypothetical protein M1376_07245 [Planctomycetes bacterium]|nr:hypothetical protein [Planctomycetota bacterium]
MNEKRFDLNPADGPARRWYVADAVLLSKIVGIHAILFAILRVIAYLAAPDEMGVLSWIIVLILLTLVLSLRLVIRMTRMALMTAIVVVYAIFFALLHVAAYLMGLQRELALSWTIAFLVLALLTLVLSLGLVIRMMLPWPKRIRDLGRRMAMCLMVTIGIVAFLVLPFTRFGWPPYKTSTRAFRKYVRANVDVNAMRTWLNTLNGRYDPNYAYELAYGATIESWWPEAAPWAKAITPLRPDCVWLTPDHNNHPAVRITGLHGHSLVVGSENMQTPPANFSTRDKYRLWLDPGAYVGRGR